jgi:hypothetical protein
MVSFGYYQAMSLYDRADIEEGKCILILIDPGAGKFAFDDLTENAVSIHTLLSPPSDVWYTLSCFSLEVPDTVHEGSSTQKSYLA